MKRKWLVGSLTFGLGVTALLMHSGRTPGSHWFDSILWLGYLAGSFASGNLHSPNEFVAWIALSCGFTGLAYGVLALVHVLWTRPSPTSHR